MDLIHLFTYQFIVLLFKSISLQLIHLIHGLLHRGELVGRGLGVPGHLGVLARVHGTPVYILGVP